MNKISKYSKIIFWNLSIFGIFTLSTESIFGTWFFGKVIPPDAIPKNGVKYDRRKLKSKFGFSQRIPDKDFTTKFKPKKNNQEPCTILLIGGSTTEERVLNKDETWAGRLFKDLNTSKKLEEKCSAGIEVINAGVSGHSLESNIYDLKFRLSRSIKKVDIVILYQGINDGKMGLMDIKTSFKRKLFYTFRYHSATYRAINNLKKSFFLKNIFIPKNKIDS